MNMEAHDDNFMICGPFTHLERRGEQLRQHCLEKVYNTSMPKETQSTDIAFANVESILMIVDGASTRFFSCMCTTRLNKLGMTQCIAAVTFRLEGADLSKVLNAREHHQYRSVAAVAQ